MKIRTATLFLKDGCSSLKRNKTMGAAAITSVIAALLVIGIFFVIVLNIDYMATNLESQLEMMVYLNDGLSTNVISTMINEIKAIDGVRDVKFVPKADALKNLQAQWGNNAYLLDGLEGDNPLPDTLILTLVDPRQASSIALSVSAVSNIAKVNYGKEELEKLLKTTYMLRMTSLAIILILVFISVFVISNTIKLTVYARRREIGIMKYVGATDWFVRGPFIVEGILLGLAGGIISTLLLGAGYFYGTNLVKEQMIGLLSISLMPFHAILSSLIFLLLSVGMVIGAIGSLMAVRRFIRV